MKFVKRALSGLQAYDNTSSSGWEQFRKFFFVWVNIYFALVCISWCWHLFKIHPALLILSSVIYIVFSSQAVYSIKTASRLIILLIPFIIVFLLWFVPLIQGQDPFHPSKMKADDLPELISKFDIILLAFESMLVISIVVFSVLFIFLLIKVEKPMRDKTTEGHDVMDFGDYESQF